MHLAGETAELGCELPRHNAVNCTATQFVTFGKGKTRNGLAVLVLDVDSHAKGDTLFVLFGKHVWLVVR